MNLSGHEKISSVTATPVSEKDKRGSIALDQWRGLALVLVLISHGFFFTNRVNGIGRVGVNLFFFISGILVFRSLSRTRATTAIERTRSFWWRRFRRLYPALITYVLAMLPFAWLLQHHANLPPGSDFSSYVKAIPTSILYVTNYFESPMSLGHLWSLACEMQFYLIAPLIYIVGGTTVTRKNFIFGSVLIVLIGFGLAQPFIGKWKYHFEFAVWPMMFGFFCEYKRHWFEKFSHSAVTFLHWFSVAVCGASLFIMFLGMEMKPVVVATGALLLAPCLMAYLYGRPMPKFIGLPMKWLGERTYSIYLWQQPFTICGYLPDMLHPIGAMVSVAVGGIWFRLFEWPFLTMSRRETEQHGVSRGNYKKLKWFVSIGVVLLIIIFSSFWILRASYENRLRQQLWPMAMPEISPASSWSTNSSPTVLLLGDSRMAQWNLPQLSGWRVVNAGKGGMTTGQLRLCAPKLLEEFHPDAVVLEAGINDLKFLGLRPEMDSQIVSLASDNLNAAVRECLKRHCKIILLETWPPDKPDLARRLVWNAKIPKAVDQLNEKLRLLDGIEGNVHVVDLFGKADIKIKEDLYRDTLHFKPEVYESLTPSLQLELDLILQR